MFYISGLHVYIDWFTIVDARATRGFLFGLTDGRGQRGDTVSVSPTVSRSADDPRERINPIAIRGFACFPTSIPRNSGKKGARSGGGRRMSASIPGGGVSALGVLSKDIYADEVTSTISHCPDLPALRCVLYVRIGRVSPRHHFIPLSHRDRAFAPRARRPSFRTNWIPFSGQCSLVPGTSLLSRVPFFLSRSSPCATWHR